MPEWDDWGGFLRDGVMVFIVTLVYTLPFWLLTCIGFMATIGFGSLSEVSEDAAAAGILATFGVIGCLSMVLVIALLFISPAIIVQYIRTGGELSACFRFGEVIGIVRDNIGDIVIIVAVLFGAIFAIGLVANIPCLGWIISFAVGPYMAAVSGHLYGQLANRSGGAPKEEKFAL